MCTVSFLTKAGLTQLKRSCESVLVRAPEWVESESPQVVCKVNGVSRGMNWEGRYVNVGAGKAGDTME